MIKHNATFGTIREVMALFGKKLGGTGPVAGFHWITKGILGAWFPKLARNTDGVLAPAGDEWLNILAQDEQEITEVWMKAQERQPPHSIPGTHRAVFVKEEHADYRFVGIYALEYISGHGRTRVYTRLTKDFPDPDWAGDFIKQTKTN
jgi:hypothetical protein